MASVMNRAEIEAASQYRERLGPSYTVDDISSERWREVFINGSFYRIERPLLLIRRKGGSTHRVLDEKGITHCYPAPEVFGTIISWESAEGVNF